MKEFPFSEVQVRMVTGDNLHTAKAIALECGILGSEAAATEPNLIEGKVFRALSDKEREDVAEQITVRSLCLLSVSVCKMLFPYVSTD